MMTDACMLTAQHTVLATPIGDLTVVREGDLLTGLYFLHHWYKPDPVTFGPRNDRGFEGVAGQLEEYLAGTRTLFDLALEPRGTEFELRVWELITQVPYGQTITYGDLVRRLGGRENAQEVGAAVGLNPLCILIPCHRVIGSNGRLAGYAGGLKRKQKLLELEHAEVTRVRRVLAPTLWLWRRPFGVIVDQQEALPDAPGPALGCRHDHRAFHAA